MDMTVPLPLGPSVHTYGGHRNGIVLRVAQAKPGRLFRPSPHDSVKRSLDKGSTDGQEHRIKGGRGTRLAGVPRLGWSGTRVTKDGTATMAQVHPAKHGR